jgi:hypothetical protein
VALVAKEGWIAKGGRGEGCCEVVGSIREVGESRNQITLIPMPHPSSPPISVGFTESRNARSSKECQRC